MAHDIRDVGYMPDNSLIILKEKSILKIGGWPTRNLDTQMDSMVISPNGEYIVTAGQYIVYIFRVKKTKNFQLELENTIRGKPESLAISEDNRYLFISHHFSGLEVRELATGVLRCRLDTPVDAHIYASGHTYHKNTFALKYNIGSVSATTWGKIIVKWGTHSVQMFRKGVLIGEIHTKDIPVLPRGVSATLEKVLFSPCGNYIALLIRGEVYVSLRVNSDICDIQNWIRGKFIENLPIIYRMAFSRDGKYLALSSYNTVMTSTLSDIFWESKVDSVLTFLLRSFPSPLKDPRLWTAIRG